jgi:hypothetical protein
MNCQNFESIVNELARQQLMEANVREQALAHTADCEACALSLADERGLTQKLRAVANEMNGLEAPARIEDELLGAFRKHKLAEPGRSANYAWRYWATAAAAVLLIVTGIAALSMRSMVSQIAAENPYIPPFQPRVAANTNNTIEPVVRVDPPKPAPLTEQAITSTNRDLKRRTGSLAMPPNSADKGNPREVPAANSDSTVAANYGGNEIATDFMPIGYTSPINLQDGGQVMRVELPRSTLARFGLPVNMERVNERVKADVLVGPDGQARAIRFVQ